MFKKFSGHVYIADIVIDDDSTLRLHCTHICTCRKIVDDIPQPRFLADPSHRVKYIVKPIFRMCSSTVKDPGRCKSVNFLRVKKYTSCYVLMNRHLNIESCVSNAKSPVKHIFNCHTWCDAAWCWVKELDDTTQNMTTSELAKTVSNQEFNYCSDINKNINLPIHLCSISRKMMHARMMLSTISCMRLTRPWYQLMMNVAGDQLYLKHLMIPMLNLTRCISLVS